MMVSLAPEILAQLRALRQDLHAHPEAAFEEKRTSGIIANHLRRLGVDEVHEHIGQYGVVAVIHGKKTGKTIALRADMDALPMQEIVPEGEVRPYASTVPGRFHGCGHDGHSAMLLGAAQYFAEYRDFAGRLILIFQPGEETLSGAAAMLGDGLVSHFPFEEIYGLHNITSIPLGYLTVNENSALSGCDNFTLTIQGRGSHGATPHLSIDPILISARLVMDFQTIISRNVPPLQAAALSFGEIHAGSAHNIIPDSLILRGTLRTYNDDVRTLVKERMQTLVTAAAMGFGTKISLDYNQNCPPLINDKRLAKIITEGLRRDFGAEMISLETIPQNPSDDFAFYLKHARGVYIFLGQGTPGTMHHHPHYDFNDALIPLGIAAWVSIVHTCLPL